MQNVFYIITLSGWWAQAKKPFESLHKKLYATPELAAKEAEKLVNTWNEIPDDEFDYTIAVKYKIDKIEVEA